MKVRAVDLNNDWCFGKGQNDYKQELKMVAQNAKFRTISSWRMTIQCFLADCFFNLSAGIDWFNVLGNKDREKLKLQVTTCLLNTQGVNKITSLDFIEDENRNFLIRYSLDTIYGEIYKQEVQGA